jgi:Ca2+-binding RTX toxin-like protein
LDKSVIDEGIDLVNSKVSYVLGIEQENLTLLGTAGLHATGNDGNNEISGNVSANTLKGGKGNDLLIGNNGHDRLEGYLGNDDLRGGNGNDALFGGGGNDTLDGQAGTDTLTGAAGNDLYKVNSTVDAVVEAAGQGIDTIQSSASYVLPAEVENLQLMGTAGLAGTGNTLGNLIYGNSAANVLKGSKGPDTLDGGNGNDTLTGGNGYDQFVFDNVLGPGNVDTVIGFVAQFDTIVIDDDIFTMLAGAGTLVGRFAPNAPADGDDNVIYNTSTGALFYDADGTGGGAAVQFAVLSGAPVIDASDFLIVG